MTRSELIWEAITGVAVATLFLVGVTWLVSLIGMVSGTVFVGAG